jgi:hypothetical protein
MNTSTIVALVVVVVVLVLAVLIARPFVRRRRLQQRFGPEYQRAVERHDTRADAERDLMDREKRHNQLELRPLPTEVRDRYAQQWTGVQAQFVDAPERTVADADRLVTALMAERGYPTEGYQQQAADLSVEHASTIEHYHAAHDARERIGDGGASTEDLREAMVHYRVLFTELLDGDGDGDRDVRVDDGDVREDMDADARDAAVDADARGAVTDADAERERGRTGHHHAARRDGG